MSANFTEILLALDGEERRLARRGRVAWYVILSALVMFMMATMLLVVDSFWPWYVCSSPLKEAYQDVVRATEQFRSQHEDRCPRDLGELKTAGVLSRVPKDPWGRPFIIECSEAAIRVCSRGEDELDPEDDACREAYRPRADGAGPLTTGSFHGR